MTGYRPSLSTVPEVSEPQVGDVLPDPVGLSRVATPKPIVRPTRPKLRTVQQPTPVKPGTLGGGGSILDYAFGGTQKVQPGYSTPSGVAVGHTPVPRPQRPKLRTTPRAETLAEYRGLYGGFERGLASGSASATATLGGVARLLGDLADAGNRHYFTGPQAPRDHNALHSVGDWLANMSARDAQDVAQALELVKQNGGEQWGEFGTRKITEITTALTPALATGAMGVPVTPLLAVQEMAN